MSISSNDLQDMFDYAPTNSRKIAKKCGNVVERSDNLEENITAVYDVAPRFELFAQSFPKVIEKTESFDINRAHHIIKNSDFYKPFLTHDSENGEEEQKNKLELLERYVKSSKNNIVNVSYSQKSCNKGRYFAKYGLSLANMGKQLRHTIANEYYDDLDMINAHPTILKFICDQSGIKCEQLTKFLDNRDLYYEMLKVDRDLAKKIYLIAVNKHEVDLAKLKKDYKCVITKQFRELVLELIDIREAVIEKYSNMADTYRKYKQSESEEELYNFEGSFINILMCDVENVILQHIIKFFGDPNDCVLCFDGVMLRKSLNAEAKIKECEKSIKKHIGIDIKLSVKPMNKGFNIENPDVYEGEGMPYINARDPYVFGDFRRQYSEKVFDSFEELIKSFSNDANRVLAKSTADEGMYIKKDNIDNDVFKKIHNISKIIDFDIKFKELVEKKTKAKSKSDDDTAKKEVVSTIPMSKLLGKCINTYDNIVCKPEGCLKHELNIWKGFKAKQLSSYDINKIQPMLTFIKEVWANNDEELYNYIMSWWGLTVQKPGTPIKAALFVYGGQGSGKNTLTDFINDYVLGDAVCGVATDINSVVQKHNTMLEGRKFMLVNELGSTKEEFKNNFNKLKHFITESKLTVEPKNVNSYEVTNISNWIFVSNHRDAIYIEDGDRRYCCIEVSDRYANNIKYFTELRKLCFNQDCGDHFFTYLMNYDCADVRVIPSTQLKRDIQQISKSNYVLFYEYFAEQMTLPDDERDEKCRDIDGSILSTKLYNLYKSWCDDNGMKGVVTNTKFGSFISTKYTKKRISGGNSYVF